MTRSLPTRRASDMQGRGVDDTVIEAERQLVQPRHLALAGLVHDLARGRVEERRGLVRLVLGEEGQDAARQAWVEPQRLQRGDHRVAAERRREPRDSRARVGTGRQVAGQQRSEEHTSELQSLMRISYAVFCLKKKKE